MLNTTKIKFRKILNDLKRRPEDAAKDLGISLEKVNNFLEGKEDIDNQTINKALNVWPINASDFFSIKDDTKNDIKIFTKEESDKSAREMKRDSQPYYLYKDTVMSRVSSFRPEWIQELAVVENSDPHNNLVKWNNGHFLHQFTYFIGPVNFYYYDEKNQKKIAEMNTGDSMYISPYTPHTFTTRKNEKNEKGVILALTYTDKIDNDVLNEMSAIGTNLSKKYALKLLNDFDSILQCVENHLKISSKTMHYIEKKIDSSINKAINNFLSNDNNLMNEVANHLDVSLRDLLPQKKTEYVTLQNYETAEKWFLPDESKKELQLVKLAGANHLPYSKALELNVLNENSYNFEVPCHQYIYNVGVTDCKIKTENSTEILKPGDSLYLKPNLKHAFQTKSKLLVLRIGGKVSGDSLLQLSTLDEKKLNRLLEDNKPWFN